MVVQLYVVVAVEEEEEVVCDQCSVAGVSLDCPDDAGHKLMLVVVVVDAISCGGSDLSGENRSDHIQCI